MLATLEDWMRDPVWVKANEPHSHRFTARGMGANQIHSNMMGRVTKEDFLGQVFYGNPIERPHEMFGFSSFYNTRDPEVAQTAACVLDGEGEEGDRLTSIWIVAWGEHSAFIATPDGEPPVDAAEAALVVRDIRYVVRISNVHDEDTSAHLQYMVDRALLMLPNARWAVIYMNSRTQTQIVASDLRGHPIRVIDALRNDEARIG